MTESIEALISSLGKLLEMFGMLMPNPVATQRQKSRKEKKASRIPVAAKEKNDLNDS
jgi:hypothetical protein